jgi:hypothetical protein
MSKQPLSVQRSSNIPRVSGNQSRWRILFYDPNSNNPTGTTIVSPNLAFCFVFYTVLRRFGNQVLTGSGDSKKIIAKFFPVLTSIADRSEPSGLRSTNRMRWIEELVAEFFLGDDQFFSVRKRHLFSKGRTSPMTERWQVSFPSGSGRSTASVHRIVIPQFRPIIVLHQLSIAYTECESE